MDDTRIKLDLKDKKILYELDANARQSNNEIAKKVGLNKNTVNYKINRLLHEKVITGFYAVIDSSRLGYFSIRIYLKFFNTTTEKEQEIIAYLKKDKSVGVLARLDTVYDLAIMTWVKNIPEFEEFWIGFKRHFRKYFWQEKVHIFSGVIHLKRKYLYHKKTEEIGAYEEIGGKNIEEIDALDSKILTLLAKNARTPIIEMVSKTKAPARTIAHRIRELKRKGILQGYRAHISLEKIGYEYYKLNFKLEDFERFDAFFKYCKMQENIIYIDKTLNELDFEIDVEVKDRKELMKLLSDIKSRFNIRDTDVLSFKEYYALESIPTLYTA